MNKYNLGIISILVVIALIAFIAVQIYWIKSSITLKEVEFDRSVKEALKSTAGKLQKIATANKIAKKNNVRKQGVRITKPILVTIGNPSGNNLQVRIFEELSTDSSGDITSKMSQKEFFGDSINEFLLKKLGKTRDDAIESDATINDIDEQSIKLYLSAAEKSDCLSEHEGLSIKDLLEKLRLSKNGQLKRAAVVLFGKDPRKFYSNMFVKIGSLGKDDAGLVFQKNEEGNLFILL